MLRLSVAAAAVGALAAADGRRCDDAESCAAALGALRASPLAPLLAVLGPRVLDAVAARGARGRAAGNAVHEPATAWCPTRGATAFEWLPATVANANVSAGWAAAWPSDGCFASVSVAVAVNATGATATLTGAGAANASCATLYLISSSYGLSPFVEISGAAPAVTAAWRWAHGAAEAADAAALGLDVLQAPCGLGGTVESLLATLPLLVGDPEAVAAANAAWLVGHRVFPPVAPFAPPSRAAALALGDAIPSGSYIAIAEWYFMASLEAFGTGFGGTSHSALAVRRDGVLHVVESTFDWLGGDGIQAHTWAEWVNLSTPVQSSVVLQLAPPLRAAFNETAFWAYYDGLAGGEYGYRNYLFSFLDTEGASLPAPLAPRAVGAVLVAADDALAGGDTGLFQPSYNASMMDLLGDGLNARLRANCTTLACVVAAAAARAPPLSLLAAAALPEDPAYRYRGQPSRVCSAFAAGGLQAALGPALPALWSTEQVPIDNWRAALWDSDAWTGANCPWGAGRSAGTNASFCQFAGARAITLPGANALPLAPRANERCASQWPAYTRCPGGQLACDC